MVVAIKTIRIAVPWSHITGCVGGNLNCEEVEMAGMQSGGWPVGDVVLGPHLYGESVEL